MGSVLEVELVEAGGAPTGVGATPSSAARFIQTIETTAVQA